MFICRGWRNKAQKDFGGLLKCLYLGPGKLGFERFWRFITMFIFRGWRNKAHKDFGGL